MNKQINAMYFSPTDTTKKIVSGIAEKISENLDDGRGIKSIDFTLPEPRKQLISFTQEDIVVLGVPVYAGRVPNVLLKYLNTIKGNGALAVPVVVYGNRNYDDALIELKDILELNGFKPIAGAAFIGEHSFSRTLAKDRPDDRDLVIVKEFSRQIYKKITTLDNFQALVVKGNPDYKSYYMPKDKEGRPVDIRKVTPKTNSDCTNCKLCVQICPMGSIDQEDVSKLNGICIKCGACIKKCPFQAKYYDSEDYLRHKYELEVEFASRKEPALFI
ncbi:EFR1 family ferrodoxin [Desulfosporosinus hippei]|uniref:4Fe-4S dicluster domain-containing protein n=1 Tax=Desulfosporosinus hippei DSM 8344 TaxID=1121419 RepID=A0A1G7Z7A9_9FIRM|nr:EFR1 family ferrodoxin [Desulfosporosinus hippei]SDH04588.1 4Fe-4S dicluster domain-containing protein [Desulfosporosinus hippei DSM 8344]